MTMGSAAAVYAGAIVLAAMMLSADPVPRTQTSGAAVVAPAADPVHVAPRVDTLRHRGTR